MLNGKVLQNEGRGRGGRGGGGRGGRGGGERGERGRGEGRLRTKATSYICTSTAMCCFYISEFAYRS